MTAERQRIDKWLWFARMAKTRTAAQKLAISGDVRVNRDKNRSASRLIATGDVLTIATPRGVRVLKMLSAGVRRGPASEAITLYEDLAPPPPPGERQKTEPAPERVKRPDKRGRRAIMALKPSFDDDFSNGSG